MALEQQMERSEELLETNEENKERVEQAKDQVRRADNRVSAAQAQTQYAYNQLQQAIAARNAAQQQASQEENGSVPASYDAAVSAAEAELRSAQRELEASRRERIEADRELHNAEGALAESTRELHNVSAELQRVSEKYGVNLSRTSQLMNLPYSRLASPLMQQLGIGKDKVDDLRLRIAASLGITAAATGGGYGGGGYSGGSRRAGGYGAGGSSGGFTNPYQNSGGGGIASKVAASTAQHATSGSSTAAPAGASQPKQGLFSRMFGKKDGASQSGKTFSGHEVDGRGFVHGSNHEAFLRDWEGYSSSNFNTTIYERGSVIQNISAASIEGINVSEHDIENPDSFWSQHKSDGTKESFVEIASHIPEVQAALDSGKSIEELLEDERLGTCTALYFDPSKMTEVMDCGDYYEFQSNGRHRVLAARELGYDIPVQIVGTRRRK